MLSFPSSRESNSRLLSSRGRYRVTLELNEGSVYGHRSSRLGPVRGDPPKLDLIGKSACEARRWTAWATVQITNNKTLPIDCPVDYRQLIGKAANTNDLGNFLLMRGVITFEQEYKLMLWWPHFSAFHSTNPMKDRNPNIHTHPVEGVKPVMSRSGSKRP